MDEGSRATSFPRCGSWLLAIVTVVQLYCASCKPTLENLTNLHKLLMFPVSPYRMAYISINMTMCCSCREAPAKKVKLRFMPLVCLYSCHVHPSTSLSLHCLYKFISLSSLWSQHSHQPSSAPLAAPVSAPQGGIPLLLLVLKADVPQSPNHKSFLSHIRDCNDYYLCLVLGFVKKTKQTTKHLKHGVLCCLMRLNRSCLGAWMLLLCKEEERGFRSEKNSSTVKYWDCFGAVFAFTQWTPCSEMWVIVDVVLAVWRKFELKRYPRLLSGLSSMTKTSK